MEVQSPVRKELLDKLRTLDIEKHTYGTTLSIKAPTWKLSPKVTIEDLADAFDDDEDVALRDYASIPSISIRPFFKDPEVLFKNAKKDKKSPINDDLTLAPWFHPDPLCWYFFAQDLSVSLDATGICLGHYDFERECVIIDFTMRISTSRSEPIDYERFRSLIFNLSERGFRFGKLLFDQFQSHDSITILKKRGYTAEVVAYADSLAGCTTAHDLVHNGRLEYGLCDSVFIGEAQELQVINSRRIDHMTGEGVYNSKDVWDAVVNVIVECMNAKAARAEKQEFVFPTPAVTAAFEHGLIHMHPDAKNTESITGIGWSRGECISVTAVKDSDTIDIVLCHSFKTSTVTEQLVDYIRAIMDDIGPTTIVTSKDHEFCVAELAQHGFAIRAVDLKRFLATFLIDNLAKYLVHRRLRITKSAEPVLMPALHNYHRDEFGKPQREGHAPVTSLAMALAAFPLVTTFPDDYGDIKPGQSSALEPESRGVVLL
jgi:hypothetical protein